MLDSKATADTRDHSTMTCVELMSAILHSKVLQRDLHQPSADVKYHMKARPNYYHI